MANFRKLQSGDWGVGLSPEESAGAMAGQALTIERKDGTRGRAILGAIVTRGEWGSIWTIAPKPAATPPAAPIAPATPVAAPVVEAPAPKKRRKAPVTP